MKEKTFKFSMKYDAADIIERIFEAEGHVKSELEGKTITKKEFFNKIINYPLVFNTLEF